VRQPSRIIAVVLLAIGAVSFFALAPKTESSVAGIQLKTELNADTAESAPQQQVVNGWAANDYLALIAEQDKANAQREAALLLVVVLVGVAILFTQGRTPAPAKPSPAPVDEAPAAPATPSPVAAAPVGGYGPPPTV
jgi:hypothetical protein